MISPRQLDLIAPPAPPVAEHEIAWLLRHLDGRDWMTADEILREVGQPQTDAGKRRLRLLAAGSSGRIAGGQRGYKLVRQMTGEEYHHYRNWMSSQANEMLRRIRESDRIFYARPAV
jgi:hypothetical protein